MISELYIDKYRGLRNLSLNELGKINIIAGENNTGKTSILEIVESLYAPNSLMRWRLIGRREGNAMRISTNVYDTMKSIFPIENDSDETEIVYSGKNDGKDFSVKLSGKFTETLMISDDIKDFINYDIEENNEFSNEMEVKILDVEYTINNQICGNDKILNIQRKFMKSENINIKIVDKVIYISPTMHADNTLYLESLMTNSELYQQFVELMKEFDPDFISINSIEEETNRRKYVVLSKKFKEGLLLNAYGDGMKKAMLILSALLRAKNGILLLDEFETAIHPSVMEKIFKWILEVAVKLNVQIFMTSHSIEAISTVLKCCPNLQSDIRMITLVNVNGDIKARNVNAIKAVQLMDDYGLELR